MAAAAAAPGGPNTVLDTVLGEPLRISKCPLGHGSVGAGPFPGYVHGAHPTICKHGCRPHPELGKNGYINETPRQALIREALEYQDLYHKDKGSPPGAKEARVAEILAEIEASGTYTHTFDELQHGARCAWRNAPKCSNRKFWEELQLVDGRAARTPQDMFDACLEVLERATLSCVTTANIAVFWAQTPGTADGPRVWNNQLIRYAGFKQPDDSVVGDPAEADFTDLVQQRFGWSPPAGADPRFTLLPVLLQAHPDQAPELFTLPPQYVISVPIRHPDNEGISALNLQWYAVPAVSCLELSVGGLTYTACPFNGWYADTEIVRNITDESRLNMCRPVAAALGLDTKSESSMWRDRAIVEVDVAVMYSFREAGMGMVDHTTLMQQFWRWYNRELVRRGYSPGNWKWIITPVSPTATKCYLQLNKMIEYTLKPGYWYAPGWRKYAQRWEKDHGALQLCAAPAAAAEAHAGKSAAQQGAIAVTASAGPAPAAKLVLAYASVTGNTEEFAHKVAGVLGKGGALAVSVLNMEEFDSEAWGAHLADADAVLVLSSTYGPGAPPRAAAKFVAWLQAGGDEAVECFKGKPTAVLGFGSSSYPRFCAAADLLHALLLAIGAKPVLPVGKADALAGEEMTVWRWVKQLGEAACARGWMDAAQQAALVERLPVSDGSKPPPFVPEFTLVRLAGEGLKAARERRCHWATVLQSMEVLPGPEGGASTKFVRLDISGVPCGNYYAGDEVCIWGENEPALVERLARQLGVDDLDEMFLLQRSVLGATGEEEAVLGAPDRFPLPNSFRTILARHAGLSEPLSFAAVAAVAGFAPQDRELARLGCDYQAYQQWSNAVVPRWSDLFDLFPSLLLRVPLATFFQLVPSIKPRYYSISSSSAVTPGEVAITVGRLTYTLPSGEQRAGFCSSYITALRPGDRARFRLVSQPSFRQPLNLAAPVIMVAAGTGLAPFRGFWQERLLRLQQGQALGPALLLFGCRSRAKDFLFAEHLEEVQAQGAITRLLPALSRESGERKAYVQDVVLRQEKELAPLLAHPRCHVYICGSSNMAQEVGGRAARSVIASQQEPQQLPPERPRACRCCPAVVYVACVNAALCKVAGKAAIDRIALEGRYHEDVFGVSVQNRAQAAAAAAAQVAVKDLAAADLSAVHARLDAGLPVDATDESASTLLHHAARHGRADLVSALLQRKAPLNTANRLGLTPTAEALLAGHTAVAAVLQAAGGQRTSMLHSSFYPLHAAMMAGDRAAARQLLADGVSPDHLDWFELSPLHIAATLGDAPMAAALLDAGASPNAIAGNGLTPMQCAVARDWQEVAKLLAAAGGSILPAHITSSAIGDASDPGSANGLANMGVSQEDIDLVRASWALLTDEARPGHVSAKLEEFGRDLFLALFDAYPTMLGLFPFKGSDGRPIDAELRKHGRVFASALGEAISLLQHTETLTRYLTDVVERHFKYGVELVHYDIVLQTMAAFIESLLPVRFEAGQRAAWSRFMGAVKAVAAQCYAARNAAGAAAGAAKKGV
ncbi:hypothetical protein ABPG75_003248 [Micractinium tetrahymenae]